MMLRIFSLIFLVQLLSLGNIIAQDELPIDEFEKKIRESGIQVLDVRTIQEYNTGHLSNTLQADWLNTSQFTDRTQYLDKSKPVYLYCASGGRSTKAAEFLRSRGFHAVNMKGGLVEWKKAGKALEAASDVGKISLIDYKKLTSEAGLTLVDFGAPWCPPCKKMEPVIGEVRRMNTVMVQYVDGGINTHLMTENKVEALPTFILYKNGAEVWRKQGVVSLEEFNQVFKKYS